MLKTLDNKAAKFLHNKEKKKKRRKEYPTNQAAEKEQYCVLLNTFRDPADRLEHTSKTLVSAAASKEASLKLHAKTVKPQNNRKHKFWQRTAT